MEEERHDHVSVLFSYIVTADSGFAPNPFFGLCTLACCKPKLRRAIGNRLLGEFGAADIHDLRGADPDYIRNRNIWVVGLAGASLRDRPRRSVVFAMQVTDVLDFASYFEEHPEKRPDRSGSRTSADPAWHGDAIYTGNDSATAVQLSPSAHSDGGKEHLANKRHDLDGQFVLLSDHFLYFGKDAPYVPLEEKLHHGRGHRMNHAPEALAELESWLNGPWARLFNSAGDQLASDRSPAALSRDCRGTR